MFSSLLLLFFSQEIYPQSMSLQGWARSLLICLLLAWMQHEEDCQQLAALSEEIASQVLNAWNSPAAKQAYLEWNRECARACVEEDASKVLGSRL